MHFQEATVQRRSIRKYRPDPVPEERLTRVLEAARLAPSGTNSQPWCFLVVRSVERRAALREAAYGQVMFGQAPCVIAILGDRQRFKKRLRRGKELVDIGAVDASVMETVGKVYGRRPPDAGGDERAIAIQCVIAGEHIVLAATAEGLGSCWVMLFDAEKVVAALGLPEHLFPVALIPIGFADQAPPARPRYALNEMAYDETMDRPWPGGVER